MDDPKLLAIIMNLLVWSERGAFLCSALNLYNGEIGFAFQVYPKNLKLLDLHGEKVFFKFFFLYISWFLLTIFQETCRQNLCFFFNLSWWLFYFSLIFSYGFWKTTVETKVFLLFFQKTPGKSVALFFCFPWRFFKNRCREKCTYSQWFRAPGKIPFLVFLYFWF